MKVACSGGVRCRASAAAPAGLLGLHTNNAATRPCRVVSPSQEANTAPRQTPLPVKWAGTGPHVHSAGVAVVSSVGSVKGATKPFNQDAFLVEHVFVEHHAACGAPLAAGTLIGVFDGHGKHGHHVAHHVSRQVAAAVHRCARAAHYESLNVDSSPSSGSDSDSSSSSSVGAGAGSPRHSPATPACHVASFTLSSAQSCLEATFRAAAEALQDMEAGAECDLGLSGSTAVVCMVLQDSVVAAWAGDSRAVVGTAVEVLGGDFFYAATQLTQDHKPEKLAEAERIWAAGGAVVRAPGPDGSNSGGLRVCLKLPGARTLGLSLSRAFGDLQLGPAGVVPTPDFAVFPRSASRAGSLSMDGPELVFPPAPAPAAAAVGAASGAAGAAGAAGEGVSPSSPSSSGGGGGSPAPLDAFCPTEVLVVASDGLWDVVANQEAVELAGRAGSPQSAAEQLVGLAQQRWAAHMNARLCDDITVAVAYL